MKQLPDIDRNFLATEGKKIVDFANSNLDQLTGKCQEKIITQDYYLGILRRQCIILSDIVSLLKHSSHNNFTSIFVLCRCLADDFLYVTYLKTKPNEDENIIRINGSAYSQSFKALEILTNSNHKHFNGSYPFYLTKNGLEKVKTIFSSREENDIYFKNKELFTFKSFMQLTQIAEKIDDFEISKTTLRAFFLWKEFSDFIHYSNMTFELEIDDSSTQIYYRYIEETMMYSFNTVEMAFRYFAKMYNLEIIMDASLNDRYFMEIV